MLWAARTMGRSSSGRVGRLCESSDCFRRLRKVTERTGPVEGARFEIVQEVCVETVGAPD